MDNRESTTIIREARREDAAQLVEFVTRLSQEKGIYILIQEGEFTMTVEEEADLLESFAATDNMAYFVAEAITKDGGQIVGGLNIRGGKRRSTRHSGMLGISIGAGWRNQGIGSRMMEAAIQWARASGVITRLELMVFAENQPAIHLYEKYGFQVEGQLRKAIYREGAYHDDLVMGLLL
jgi:RimJ/RimL family protein N-acetyltransferase